MARQDILTRVLRALADAVHALAKALERMAGTRRPQADASAAMQAQAERFPGAPEHWLQMIAEKAPQLADAASTEASEEADEWGPAPPPLQLGRRPGREPPEEIPEPTPFGPVSTTRPWLTGQAPVVNLRPVAQETPKLAPSSKARPIGRALADLARRRALAAAAAGEPQAPPKADAPGRDAYSAANTDGAAPSAPDAERQRPDAPASAPSVAPEVRSFRPTGGTWATPEPPAPSNDVSHPPAPVSREEPPEAHAEPASHPRAPLTDWPWRPHAPPRDAAGEYPRAPSDQPYPPLDAPPGADHVRRSVEPGFSEAAPSPRERARFADRADDRWPDLPAWDDEVEAPASDVARSIREQEEGGWNA